MTTSVLLAAILGLAAASCGKATSLEVPGSAGQPTPSRLIFGQLDLSFTVPSGEEAQAGATVAIFDDVEASGPMVVLPSTPLEPEIRCKKDFCDGHEICPTIRKRLEGFLDQPSGARCSGVLVARDLIATADHCGQSIPWSDRRFVFGYAKGVTSVPARQCHRGTLVDHDPAADWALIKLDQEVAAEVAVPVTMGAPTYRDSRTSAHSFGHALGLPRVRSGEDESILYKCGDGNLGTDLDRFKYSSGSPVFENSSNKMVGLLRTEDKRDFTLNAAKCCTLQRGNPVHDPPASCSRMVVPSKDFEGAVAREAKRPSAHAKHPRGC